MPSVRSLFLGFHSLVEDVGNCKAFRVFALKVQVIDCNVTHTVSGCGLCSEIIHSVWWMAATSFWFHLRKKKNLPVEIVYFSFFFPSFTLSHEQFNIFWIQRYHTAVFIKKRCILWPFLWLHECSVDHHIALECINYLYPSTDVPQSGSESPFL